MRILGGTPHEHAMDVMEAAEGIARKGKAAWSFARRNAQALAVIGSVLVVGATAVGLFAYGMYVTLWLAFM
jgi:hypothetical protein